MLLCSYVSRLLDIPHVFYLLGILHLHLHRPFHLHPPSPLLFQSKVKARWLLSYSLVRMRDLIKYLIFSFFFFLCHQGFPNCSTPCNCQFFHKISIWNKIQEADAIVFSLIFARYLGLALYEIFPKQTFIWVILWYWKICVTLIWAREGWGGDVFISIFF